MMVTLKPKLSPGRPGVVYASVECGGELLINATLDYCLSACRERGYTIENGQEVLLWLFDNTTFVGNS
jgi:hypothetical protein